MELADFLLNRNTAQTTKVTLTGELAEFEFEIHGAGRPISQLWV